MHYNDEVYKEVLRIKVTDELNSIGNPKCLYVHKDLLDLLNFAVGFKLAELVSEKRIFIFEHDVEAIDIDSANNVVLFLHPIVHHMKTVASIVLHNASSNVTKNYYLYFVPNVDFLCVEELKRQTVAAKINIRSFHFGAIPLAPRVVSQQLSKHCSQLERLACMNDYLLKLTNQVGQIRNIVAKGEKAKQALQTLQSKVQEMKINQAEQEQMILIVLDRSVDMITPLITGHSYEAMLDYFFGITMNQIAVPGKLLNQPNNQSMNMLLHNNKDPIYQDIAYLNIQELPDHLKRLSDQLRNQISERKAAATDLEALSKINQTLVGKYEQLQNHRSILGHIFEQLNNFHFINQLTTEAVLLQNRACNLEEMHHLTLFYPVEYALRLICLYSQVCEGASFYSRYEKELLEIVVNNYGPEHAKSLYLLQKQSILRQSKFKSRWVDICEAYNLLPDQPHDYTHLHIMYSSLIVRFVELLLRGSITPQLSILLGKDNYIRGKVSLTKPNSTVYICIIGALTYSEIACFRQLQKTLQVKIVLSATNVCSGNQMIKYIISETV